MALSCALAALLSLPLGAHDFWIEPTTFAPPPNSVLGVHLRVGDDFAGEVVGRNEAGIESFFVATAEGQQAIPGRQGGDPAGIFRVRAPGTLLVAYRSRPSAVELPASQFEQYLREEGLERIIEERARAGQRDANGREQFSRSVKALLHAGGVATGGHDRELGLTLELVPEQDPLSLPRGQKLPVRLMYEGRPLQGALIVALTRGHGPAAVTAGTAPVHPHAAFRARSDANGRVEVPLGPGVWLIKAVHMVPAPEGAGADWESVWATLTFEVPASPHPGPRAAHSAAADHDPSTR